MQVFNRSFRIDRACTHSPLITAQSDFPIIRRARVYAREATLKSQATRRFPFAYWQKMARKKFAQLSATGSRKSRCLNRRVFNIMTLEIDMLYLCRTIIIITAILQFSHHFVNWKSQPRKHFLVINYELGLFSYLRFYHFRVKFDMQPQPRRISARVTVASHWWRGSGIG